MPSTRSRIANDDRYPPGMNAYTVVDPIQACGQVEAPVRPRRSLLPGRSTMARDPAPFTPILLTLSSSRLSGSCERTTEHVPTRPRGCTGSFAFAGTFIHRGQTPSGFRRRREGARAEPRDRITRALENRPPADLDVVECEVIAKGAPYHLQDLDS